VAPSPWALPRPLSPPPPIALELGDLFEYKLKEPVTIHKNHSALVPIVHSFIAAEKFSVWRDDAGLPRPQRALWLTNSSGHTLAGGSFSVLEQDTFAGEGIFDTIRPGERRLVSYASDLRLTVRSGGGTEQQHVTRCVVNRGVMTHHREILEKKTYTLHNEDTSPRSLLIEHPVRPGYGLRHNPRLVEETSGVMRFRLPVEPKQTASMVVEEARPLQTTDEIANVTPEEITLFVRQGSIDKTVEAALQRVVGKKEVIHDLEKKKEALGEEAETIFDDQQRLRENMKALRGSAEEKALTQRYTHQLDEQENRLASLRQQTQHVDAQGKAAQAGLDQMIQELSFDVKL
jgi:chaperonin cofactor prefoldin